jgi:two-component system CheB/CheR fusion protein
MPQLNAQPDAINRHLSVAMSRDHAEELFADAGVELRKILLLVQQSTAVDFSDYKETLTRRRIGRRMRVLHVRSLGEYLAYFETHPAEIQDLYRGLLISVSRFFQDPDSFEALAESLEAILRNRDTFDPFRVWVPGCSTGEEVYSLAICLQEVFLQLGASPALQIFGTDINDSALETARAARYPEMIAHEVSPERLQLYFRKTKGRYRVNKLLRDRCVFAKHDLTRDPPFARLDLISCRNTLIYLNGSVQREVLLRFRCSLKNRGLLFLGPVESIGQSAELFQILDLKHRVYSQRPPADRCRKVATCKTTIAIL